MLVQPPSELLRLIVEWAFRDFPYKTEHLTDMWHIRKMPDGSLVWKLREPVKAKDWFEGEE